jgi:general secretion pathway protein A
MYSRHFDLKRDPFSIAPDPRFLFMSERHREALAHLLFGVTGTGGFVLLTGDIGTGKTTVCRCFLEQIPANCNVAIVFNPKQSVLELLQNVCEEFHVTPDLSAGEPSLKTYVDTLNAYLLQSHAAGQSNVLIIDEAQNLTHDVLEQLRLLTNLETHERKLLQIVLIGQPELRGMLEQPSLEQLAQRVIARYHLESLNAAETQRYIQHRLTVAGHTGPLPFDTKALRRVFALSRGVPRRINLLCGRALLGAWAQSLHRVDSGMVDKAAGEVFGVKTTDSWMAVRSHAWPLLALSIAVAVSGYFLWSNGHRTRTEPMSHAVAPPTPLPAPLAVAPVPMEDVDALMPSLSISLTSAWRALGPLWKLEPGSDDPCQAAVRQQLVCHRASELTFLLLRQLGRPGILTLQRGTSAPVYTVLTGLNDQAATLLLDGKVHRVTLASLTRVWQGDFATYWQPPPGYTPDGPDGAASPALGELSSRLSILEGKPAQAGPVTPLALDGALKARVKAFQKGQGIKSDGHPGPMTYMQLEKALGLSRVSLEDGAH